MLFGKNSRLHFFIIILVCLFVFLLFLFWFFLLLFQMMLGNCRGPQSFRLKMTMQIWPIIFSPEMLPFHFLINSIS